MKDRLLTDADTSDEELMRRSSSSRPPGLSPSQVKNAYGVNEIAFEGNVVGNGSGQTIAIVDALTSHRGRPPCIAPGPVTTWSPAWVVPRPIS